jgi:hypothetical protein
MLVFVGGVQEEQQRAAAGEVERLNAVCDERQSTIATLESELQHAQELLSAQHEEHQHQQHQQQQQQLTSANASHALWYAEQSRALQQRMEAQRNEWMERVSRERAERDRAWRVHTRALQQRVTRESIAKLHVERALHTALARAHWAESQLSAVLAQAKAMATAMTAAQTHSHAGAGAGAAAVDALVPYPKAADWKKQSDAQIAMIDAQIAQLSGAVQLSVGSSLPRVVCHVLFAVCCISNLCDLICCAGFGER